MDPMNVSSMSSPTPARGRPRRKTSAQKRKLLADKVFAHYMDGGIYGWKYVYVSRGRCRGQRSLFLFFNHHSLIITH